MDDVLFDNEAIAHIIVGCIKYSKSPLETSEYFKKTYDDAVGVIENQHKTIVELEREEY